MNRIKRKAYDFFIGGESFRKEFKRQFAFLVIVTLGFTIAFSWRQTIFDISQSFVIWLTNIHNSNSASVLASAFITLISLVVIFVTSKLMGKE